MDAGGGEETEGRTDGRGDTPHTAGFFWGPRSHGGGGRDTGGLSVWGHLGSPPLASGLGFISPKRWFFSPISGERLGGWCAPPPALSEGGGPGCVLGGLDLGGCEQQSQGEVTPENPQTCSSRPPSYLLS